MADTDEATSLGTIVQVKLTLDARLKPSVTVMVIGLLVTATVGDPAIRPEPDMLNPVGRPPLVIAQANDGTPVPVCTLNCRLTVSPIWLSWLPGLTKTGSG